jgi:hypothetical protein
VPLSRYVRLRLRANLFEQPARFVKAVVAALVAATCAGCGDTPHTCVALDNAYPASSKLVVYEAFWQAVPFGEATNPPSNPIPPGGSSGLQTTVAASDNTAYVILAPGWDPASSTAPTSFVVMESKSGFAVSWNGTLHIPVDDAHFDGNCAAGSHLTQKQADLVTQLVFAGTFASFHYDAVTCTATPIGDAGP